jgi:signal transduction histidine kinase
MAAQVRVGGAYFSVTTGRAAQVSWLLFALLALSLALPGIPLYRQLLQSVCTGAGCVTGQLTPAEEQAVVAFSGSLSAYADLAFISCLLTYILLFLTAVALIWRKPTNRAVVCGAFALTALATSTLAQATAQTSPALALPAQFIGLVQLAALLPFFCLIPDGRFRPGWLRWAVLAVVPGTALVAFELVGPAANQTIGIVIAVLAAGSVLYRYRSLAATPDQEQVAWVLAAMALLATAQLMGRPKQLLPLPALSLEAIPNAYIGFFAPFGALLVVGALACLVVALLSDELFHLEIALNRALVYSLLSLFVVAGYVLVVGYLSSIFQSSGNIWFSLIATGVMAAAFQPVRERLQRYVNHLLYGKRAEPYEVIAGLGQRLEATLAAEAVLPTIAETVRESLQLPYVAIALEQNGTSDVAAEAGTPLGELTSFPLTYKGVLVGHLLVAPRPGSAALDAADRTLLADLAQQAGIAVHGVRTTAELRQLADKLQQSRERLVLALEDERRRLRRDLHDDLAPTLIGLSLRAGTISDLIDTDPRKARVLADTLDSGIRNAVGNIRRLVYDLRPPALDDLGLTAAIRERAMDYSGGEGLRVELPAALEVAAYRIVQEGLANVVKHAQAHTCHIGITLKDGLAIEITDDGVGIPTMSNKGIGLRSIRERAEELGGTCEITHNSGGGTRIRVCLPVEHGGTEVE